MSTPNFVLRGLARLNASGANVRFFAVGAAGTFLLRLLAMGLGVATGPVLARAMGSVEYGKYAYAMSWINLLSAGAGLRAQVLVTRGVASSVASEEWGLLKGLLRRTTQAVLVSSLVTALLMVAGTYVLGPRTEAVDQNTFLVGAALLPVLGLMMLRQGTLEGLRCVLAAQLPEVVVRRGGFVLLLFGVLLFSGHKLNAFEGMSLHGAATFLGLALALGLSRHYLPPSVRRAASVFRTREWIGSLVPLAASSLLMALNGEATTMVVGALAPSEDVGVYAAATRVAVVTALILASVNTPLGPIVAQLHWKGEKQELRQAVQRSARVALAATAPFLLVAVFPGPILSIFGPDFVRGSTTLQLLVVGYVLSVAAGPCGVVLLMTGHEKTVARTVLLSACANIGLCFFLIPKLGILGAAIGSVTSTILWNAILLVECKRRLGLWTTPFGP